MYTSLFITSVLDWEHRIEIETERRKNHRTEPITNFLAPVQRLREQRKPFFGWFSKPARARQPIVYYPNQECCQEG